MSATRDQTKSARASGVLLHPTSLPSQRFGDALLDAGSGDFGGAVRFLDWLAEAGQSLWQVLPLNPVGPGCSPYTSVSAHAGNPWLVSPLGLHGEGWLTDADLAPALVPAREARDSAAAPADFARSARLRGAWLRTAAQRFYSTATPAARDTWVSWCDAERAWLDDYALFMALRDRYGEALSWTRWPADLARRDPGAMAAARSELHDEADYWRFVQWCFDRQWSAVHAAARARGIRVVGDMPIYVAFDSADVWAAPHLFDLDDANTPRAVAGVPPDYFSATGQLWGNPLYRWDRHEEEGYAWWSARLASALRRADLVRIDHFRGFASYWEVPAAATTAIDGRWRQGPRRALFTALERNLGVAPGALPVVAEDLGFLTPDVPALIADVGVPCMRVLQFGFGGADDNLNLPHHYPEACAAYSGTHDNDTTLGWFAAAPEHVRAHAVRYLNVDGRDIGWDVVRAVGASAARYAIYPMQDVLGLGTEARMNTPSVAEGQWTWRFEWAAVEPWRASRLRDIAAANGRAPASAPARTSFSASA